MQVEIWLEPDLDGFPKNGRILDLLKLEPKSGITLVQLDLVWSGLESCVPGAKAAQRENKNQMKLL